MDIERYQRVKAVFIEAGCRSGAERAAYLRGACADDPSLVREVETLLAAGAVERGFLESPAVDDEGFRALVDESLAWPSDDELPERIGRYRVIRCIGEGGMGRVYEAEQEAPRRRVALKVIRTALLSRRARQRFEQEVQILGRLRHAGIAQIHEAGLAEVQTPGGVSRPVPFYAMEYIDGPSLTHFAAARGLSTTARIELVARICEAVHSGHQRGVIHRDLKPSNILVEVGDGEHGARPKVIDFGVARTMDHNPELTASHTHAGQVVGTIAYMSPEQLGGDPSTADARSDVYALGVIIFELLTGSLPFDLNGKLLHEAARVIRDVEPRRLSSLCPVLRGDIETIVAKALEKTPGRRYQSAAELGADLRRLLRNEPIIARAPTLGYQLGRFARRHKELAGGVTAAFVLLLAGVVGTSLEWLRASRAEKTALAAVDAAEASEVQARREATRAIRANDVLQGILAFAKPGMEGGGRDVRMVAVLDEASRQFAEKFAEVPELEAVARRTLGETYFNLGLYGEAVENLTRALELTERAQGPRTEEALLIRERLARTLVATGFEGAKQAVPVARAALEEARSLLGPTHRTTLLLHQTYASAAGMDFKSSEAEAALQELIATLESLPSKDRPVPLAAALTHQARYLAIQGRLGEAERIQRQALAIEASEGMGPSDVESPGIANLAWIMQGQGRLDESEQGLRDALALQKRILGERHTATLTTQQALAGQLARTGEREEALSLILGEITAIDVGGPRSPAALGHPGPDLIVYLEMYAMALMDDQRSEAFPGQVVKAVDAARRTLGDGHFLTQEIWRRGTMRLGLRVQQPWASEGLRNQVRQMVTDALIGQVTTTTFGLDEVRWSSLRWTLSEHESGTMRGGLHELWTLPDPPAGLYRLTLEVDREGSPPIASAEWMLVAPWHLDLRFACKVRSVDMWAAALETPPAEQQDVSALALAGWWGPGCGFGPDHADYSFGIVATTAVSLPPGDYRLLVTADDGIRVFLDDQLVIERWSLERPSATEAAVVQWSEAPRALRVEYCQDGGDSRLWVRAEPLNP